MLPAPDCARAEAALRDRSLLPGEPFVGEIAEAVAIALQPDARQTTMPRPLESDVRPAVV